VAIPAGRQNAFFEGPCIVVQVAETQWYVAVPHVAQPGEYRVVSKPPERHEAFQTCKGLNELKEDDWTGRHGLECGLLPHPIAIDAQGERSPP
jgi:hypothetical protein